MDMSLIRRSNFCTSSYSCGGKFKMFIKSNYIYEKNLKNKLFLLNLLTFKYLILDEEDVVLWYRNRLIEMNRYNELILEHFIVDDDLKLFNLAIKTLANKGNMNPNHVIYITDECNQRCTYCFERTIDILGKKNKVLTYDQMDKIIATISALNIKYKKDSSITIFGGEPLLEKNKYILEYLLESCEKNNIPKVDIVTNGITLKLYADIINKYNLQIGAIIVTLNGYKEIHELVRGSTDKPTFDIINDNIKYLLNNTENIKIRINILLDKLNISELNSLLVYLKKEKISTSKRVSIAFGRIQFRTITQNGRYNRELPYEDYYSSIINHYYNNELVEDEMIEGSEVSILSNLYKFWNNSKLAYPELKGCTAIYPGRFCYFIDGNIYPCTEIAGIEEYSIGNYMEQGIDEIKYESWKNYEVKKLIKCKKCKYIGLCNGACPVSNITINGNINEVYCLNIEKSLDNFIEALYKKGYFYGQS